MGLRPKMKINKSSSDKIGRLHTPLEKNRNEQEQNKSAEKETKKIEKSKEK